MTNNDIMRRIRYIFDFSDASMMSIFALADLTVSRAEVSDMLKQEEDPAFKACDDVTMATFLNGFIVFKRGKREGPAPVPETRLNNNIIFMKLKIALNLKAEEVLALVDSVDFRLSKHELSAFFRKADHKHYRECQNQIL